MGNVCACCKWGADSKTRESKKNDVWFEHDSVPLVSARHGLDDIESNEADGKLKRAVLIRSPRTANASTSGNGEPSDRQRTGRHVQRQLGREDRQDHSHRTESALVGLSSTSHHSPRRSKHEHQEEENRGKHRHRHPRKDRDDGNDEHSRYDRGLVTSTSLDVHDRIQEMRPPSLSPARSPRATSYPPDAASSADDEVASVSSTTRSHGSYSASSSPKASSHSGSPQKKPRYGRKHYRAKVNRN